MDRITLSRSSCFAKWILLWLSGTIILSNFHIHAEERAPVAVREIRVRVLDLHGKPAPGRTVHLHGLSRFSMHPDGRDPRWDFTTDADGRCLAQLSNIGFDSDHPNNNPGWGVYAFRVDPDSNDAGAFSPYLIHERDKWSIKNEFDSRKRLEWGNPIVVSGSGLELTLRIKAGITISGQVLEYPNRQPLKGVRVSASYDLYAETHTGAGGEIFGPDAETNAEGRFTFTHIYPSKCALGIGWTDSAAELTWLQTKRDGRWHLDALDEITPAARQKVVSIQITAAARPLFRYFGRVVDKAHHPVPGAIIHAGISLHRQPKGWEDNHGSIHATTDAAGRYDIQARTPWIRYFAVEATGFQRFDLDSSDDWDAPLSPGAYNFTLKRSSH